MRIGDSILVIDKGVPTAGRMGVVADVAPPGELCIRMVDGSQVILHPRQVAPAEIVWHRGKLRLDSLDGWQVILAPHSR